MSEHDVPNLGGESLRSALTVIKGLPECQTGNNETYWVNVPEYRKQEVYNLCVAGGLFDLMLPPGEILYETYVNTWAPRLDKVRVKSYPDSMGVKCNNDPRGPWVFVSFFYKHEFASPSFEQTGCVAFGISLETGSLQAGRQSRVFSALGEAVTFVPDIQRPGTDEDVLCIENIVAAIARPSGTNC